MKDRRRQLDEILDTIENCRESIKSVHSLLAYTKHSDDEVRFRALEKLREFDRNPSVEKRSCELLHDPDPLVRIEALEILEDYEARGSTQEVLSLVHDEDELVRGFAALTLGWIGVSSAIPTLVERLGDAKGPERVRIEAALVLLGQKPCFTKMLNSLRDGDYRVRCAAANLAVVLVESGRVETSARLIALRALDQAAQEETTVAARSSVLRAISELRPRSGKAS